MYNYRYAYIWSTIVCLSSFNRNWVQVYIYEISEIPLMQFLCPLSRQIADMKFILFYSRSFFMINFFSCYNICVILERLPTPLFLKEATRPCLQTIRGLTCSCEDGGAASPSRRRGGRRLRRPSCRRRGPLPRRSCRGPRSLGSRAPSSTHLLLATS